MNQDIPKVFVDRPSKESILCDFQLQFEFNNFKSFERNETISAKMEMPEIDAVCSVDLTPHSSNPNGYFYSKCIVSVKGLNKEFQTPNKYQIKIFVKTKDFTVVDSGFINIASESVFKKSDCNYRDTFLKYLSSSGSLVLDINVTVKLLKATSACNLVHNPMIMYKRIANNIEKMLNDPQFSDFKFIVKGKEFKVHREILAASSPVFVKLFTADMQEARTNKCIVEDIEPEIFEHLLRFVYGGNLPDDVAGISMKLFEAAHYYEIEQIKEICKQEFPITLTIENAVELYEWACVYEEDDLKMKAWEIIKRDILKIFLPLENEPPTPQLLQEMIKQKQQEQTFWLQFKKKPESAKHV